MAVLMLYVPVIHEGYIKLFREQAEAGVTELYLPGQTLIDELTFLEPEIRAVTPQTIQQLITSLGLFDTVTVMEPAAMPQLWAGERIVTVDEGFSKRLVNTYFPDHEVEFSTMFLRWDEANVLTQTPVDYDRLSTDPFDLKMMALAEAQAEQSGDWWRQVGGVLVKGWQPMVTSHNRHLPSQLAPYAEGDPRDFVPAGTSSEITTALHCEQSLIAQAAKLWIQIEGSWIYVTTYPCPMCAKFIAYCGIKRVYFRRGHASLDGQRVLKDQKIELIHVPEPK